ncbi:uncharacterized protein ColSpa_09775 [Colletotrichum spaethianum]|uniref:Uncharacterized protein n=1 Tax=Colletotrichum spaethianum TaxID=700344 RepID=A0AA37PCD3_9PEZI|nr:uncharacterized protein ColSpa_09775 [Colletotrichum spaethianum]GKT49594.1 hypothetical protein ColSpa_09775 [Colletotrichum spaethianum]
MHLLKIISLAAAIAPAVLGENYFGTPLPSSTAADEYLSNNVKSLPSTVTGAVATSLASALYSVDRKYYSDNEWTTVYSHMWSAAAKATNAPDVVASMAVEGYSLSDQQEAQWWKDNVPDKDDKWVSSYISDWQKAWQDTVATQTSKGGAPKCTGMAIAGVAAGVAAGVMAAM